MDDSFHYCPIPNARGGFTTRAVLGAQITEAELNTAVSTATGLPQDQCAAVFSAYLRALLSAAGGSRWSSGLYGLVRFNPIAGGSRANVDDLRTAEAIGASVGLSFTAEAVRAWRQELRLASQGLRGLVTPIIASIISCQTGQPDEYVPGSLITVRGQHLKLDRNDSTQGIFLLLEDGTEVRCPNYGHVTRLQMTALVPEEVSGPVRVRIAVLINGSVRSVTHPTPLRQASPPVAA